MKYKEITKMQAKDSGLTLALLFLLLALKNHETTVIAASFIVIVVSMTVPAVFKPFAFLWFSFSRLSGLVVSRVILALVFFCMVTPIGLIRRIIKGKSDRNIVDFMIRVYTFKQEDLQNPY
jgi:hypothetical protein